MNQTLRQPASRPRRHRTLAAATVLGLVALAGCGSDDGPSAQEQYCEAGDALRSSVAGLIDIDLIAGGLDGLNDAIQTVQDDVGQLRESATDAAADEVDALQQSIDDLGNALSELGGSLSVENASTVSTAVQGVATAAQDVFATLSDCP